MDPSEARSQARELLAGLTEPSLPSVLGALLVAVLLWSTAAARIGWDSVAEGWWLSSPVDDYAALAAECLSLQRAPMPVLPVVLIGSSASREALVDTHALSVKLGRELKLPPHEVSVHGLFAGDLRPVEMLALTACLPEGFDGLVLASISPQVLSEPESEIERLLAKPRLPLRSEAQRAWAEAHGHPGRAPTGVPLLDAPGFFLARPQALLNHRHALPPKPEFHQIENLPDPSAQAWTQLIVPRLRAWVKDYPERHAQNLSLYAALLEDLRARGAVAALEDAPRNPKALEQALAEPAERAVLDRYEADVAEFTENQGAAWLQPMAGLGLGGAAFKDHSHIDDWAAREAWTEALALGLARALREAGWTPSRPVGPPPPTLRQGSPPAPPPGMPTLPPPANGARP